mmetsp:Transcript_8940/g.13755  ORF Transcript_8940/g.13755 Transcript_8940/m.13755 type:complete len:141 (+) Transcript_8940:154-576(+)|eukprot:CAMPEP_0178901886 /NCGR_PEP_ID=MMETSP0786-20121207/4291_1 /TAXON_ID=186022 /ORGANISM="Thalassionema frauenfeldii, Strain CCMP 1798" /LENGTH=140 /DNA_ID=CAMNT_0020573077 /DNA_START=96 /DNA_END=518 /DNA_ORIENTATION=-
MMQRILFRASHTFQPVRKCYRILLQERSKKSLARPPSIKRRRRKSSSPDAGGDLPFGMNPVDYSIPPPIAPTLIPPPPKRGLRGMLLPLSMFTFFATGIYFYFNHDPETYDYWRKVETGGNIFDFGNDDDVHYEDEEDEE